jgi:hypothetical protein
MVTGTQNIRVERESPTGNGRRVDKGVADIDVISIQRVNPVLATGQPQTRSGET